MYPFSFIQSETSFTTPSLTLGWDNISNADILVGDASDVANWNTFFDLPTNGNPFTLVKVIGNNVNLVGGSNINLKDNLFAYNSNLVSVVDTANCIITAGDNCFFYCSSTTQFNLPLLTTAGDLSFTACTSATSFNLPQLTTAGNACLSTCSLVTTLNLPLLTTAGNYCFFECYSATTFNLPLLTTAGEGCFYLCTSVTSFNLPSCVDLGGSVGDNNVFTDITENTITLEIPKALLTCNEGNPDGDIQYLQANNSVTITTPLALEFNDISNANLLVGDATSVSDWNTFFELPTNGTPFTEVSIYENTVKLNGGSGIHLKDFLFVNNTNLISVVDRANCISTAGNGCFTNCTSIIEFNLPSLETVGLTNVIASGCFENCTSVTTFNFPLLESAGDFSFVNCNSVTTFELPSLTIANYACFASCTSATTFNLPSCVNVGATVANNFVFQGITGNTIALTIPSSRMTCNSGNPDGDIQYLQANNTVTVTTT